MFDIIISQNGQKCLPFGPVSPTTVAIISQSAPKADDKLEKVMSSPELVSEIPVFACSVTGSVACFLHRLQVELKILFLSLNCKPGGDPGQFRFKFSADSFFLFPFRFLFEVTLLMDVMFGSLQEMFNVLDVVFKFIRF